MDPLNVCGMSLWLVPYSLSKSNVFDAVTASFEPCVVPWFCETDTAGRPTAPTGSDASR